MHQEVPKSNPVFDRLRGKSNIGNGSCEMLPMRDGVRLFMQCWTPEGTPRKVVICFHGAGGHGQFFSLFADFLIPAGNAVFVADYRGHGLSEGTKGDIPSFQTFLDDCRDILAEVTRRLPGTPVFILGESMGGAMAVNFAAQNPGEVSGVILLSPALQFRKSIPWPDILYLPYYLAAAMAFPGKPVIPMTGHEDEGIRNPVHVEYDRTDPHHLKKISLRYFFQLNKYMAIALKECPEKIKVPLILFQGGADPGIDPAGAKSFIERLASEDKSYVEFPGALHVLLTDPNAEGLRDKILNWISER